MISGNRRIPLVYSSEKEKEPVLLKYSPVIKRLVPANNAFTTVAPNTSEESIFGTYSWMLIDNVNEVWVADSDLSNLRTTGTTIPLGSNYWGFGTNFSQKCLWTGQYWLFGNRVDGKILRSDINLQSWSVVSGAQVDASAYDMSTNGSDTIVITPLGKFSYVSTNNGLTWSPRTFFLDKYFTKTYFDNSLWIITQADSFVSSDVLLSTNNGQSFLTTILDSQVLCICRNPTTGEFILSGRTKTWKSNTNGETWESSNIVGVTFNLIGEILFDGTKYVGIGLYDGPMWSTDAITWTNHTTSDGSVLNGFDYDYNRLHYNGTRYTFRNGTNNQLYKSSDGKSWSSLAHPTAGRWFIDSYPKAQDVNLNIK